MGVAKGGTWGMLTKIYKFHNMSPFCQFYRKVVLRLNEHDDVIETQIIKILSPQNFLANSVPAVNMYFIRPSCILYELL